MYFMAPQWQFAGWGVFGVGDDMVVGLGFVKVPLLSKSVFQCGMGSIRERCIMRLGEKPSGCAQCSHLAM